MSKLKINKETIKTLAAVDLAGAAPKGESEPFTLCYDICKPASWATDCYDCGGFSNFQPCSGAKTECCPW